MVTMLKNKCSMWKRIKFPTFWYNCYYFTWSDTYFIQLETLLINHPSYISNWCSVRMYLTYLRYKKLLLMSFFFTAYSANNFLSLFHEVHKQLINTATKTWRKIAKQHPKCVLPRLSAPLHKSLFLPCWQQDKRVNIATQRRGLGGFGIYTIHQTSLVNNFANEVCIATAEQT